MGSNTTGGEAGGLGDDKRRPRKGGKTMAGTAPERLRPGAACAGCQRGCGAAPGSDPGRLRERLEGLSEMKICSRSRIGGENLPSEQKDSFTLSTNAVIERIFSRGRRMWPLASKSADPGEACGAVLKQYRILYMYYLF